MVELIENGLKSERLGYDFGGSKSLSGESLNSFKRLPLSGSGRKARSDGTYSGVKKGKDSGESKGKGLYLGAKVQPAWATRNLKINPVTSDDFSRFLGNEHHTQRWSIVSQFLYIVLYNLRRLPFLWSIFMLLCELISPLVLPRGVPRRSWYSSAVPLLASLFTSVFVHVLEFRKRYSLGRFLDGKKCLLLREGKLSSVRSGEVAVGNILKLSCDEQIPADCAVLYSSNPDGALYLDTCYLDGQTDLKTKHSIKDFKIESSLRSYSNLRGSIICDKPSPDMGRFSGLLKIKGYPRPCNIRLDNFVMRGSVLRNTSYVYVVVVYTGPDTKASQNLLRVLKPIKLGCLEQTINAICILLGLVYLGCLLSSVIVRYLHVLKGIGKFNRNATSQVDSLSFIIFRFTVLYAPLIPTTLPAVMDLLRLLYSPFYNTQTQTTMVNRLNCDHPPEDSGTWTLNSGLSEELGMVDFIFTDKTGTLTTNELNIALVTINNHTYTIQQLIHHYNANRVNHTQPSSNSVSLGDNTQLDQPNDSVQHSGVLGESDEVGDLGDSVKSSKLDNLVDVVDNSVESMNDFSEDEHFMRLLCICNPCLNLESNDSFKTLSSYKSNYSRGYSLKLNHLKTKSFHENNHTSDSNTSPLPQPNDSVQHTQLGESSEVGDSVERGNLDDRGDLGESTQHDNLNDTVDIGGSVNPVDIVDSDDEDELGDLPLYKKSKSKAHFGTVSYINDPNVSRETLEPEICEDFRAEERRYLSCVSREDECMANLASECGYYVVNRGKDRLVADCNGRFVTFEVLGVNEFTSSRKRMSVLVTDTLSNEHFLYVKGEANAMLSVISDESVKYSVQSRLRKNQVFGYRVIICAFKRVTPTQFLEYKSLLLSSGGLQNDEICSLLETELTYLGIVMFRDEVQKNIVNTLDLLMDSGIRIWVLTGDNKEATIQTCYLAKLLVIPSNIFIVRASDLVPESFTTEELDEAFDGIYNRFISERNKANEQLCLVIESDNLEIVLKSQKGQQVFMNMACSSDVVLGCLLTPIQKGQLVKMVKTKLIPAPITLSIGDGINDIQMLQHSHISVCLLNNSSFDSFDSLNPLNQDEPVGPGSEGYNDIIGYCDFCVNNFSNLRQLLLKQGTRMLKSTSLVIYFTIYKGLVFILPIFYYQIFTNWVGLDLYGSLVTILYQLVFTLVPLVIFILFYQDLSYDLYNHVSILYTISRRRIYLNINNSLSWIFEGIIGSVTSYFPLHILIVCNDNVYKGEVISNRSFGLLISVASIIIFNTKLLVNYTPNTLIFNIVSIVYYLLSTPLYVLIIFLTSSRSLKISSQQILKIAPFYFLIPIWITFTLLVNILSNLLQLYILPNLVKYIKLYIIQNAKHANLLPSMF